MDSEERKTQAVELSLRGYNQHQIAAMLGCGQSTVSKDLEEFRRGLKRQAAEDRRERIEEELDRQLLLIRDLWQAREFKHLLTCLDMRYKLLGAYRAELLVTSASTAFPWEVIASDSHEVCPIEARINALLPAG